jgi:hypothetical protein
MGARTLFALDTQTSKSIARERAPTRADPATRRQEHRDQSRFYKKPKTKKAQRRAHSTMIR